LDQSDSLRALNDPMTDVDHTARHDVSEAQANVRDAVRAYGAWLRTQGASLEAAETAIRGQIAAADLSIDEHSDEFAADLLGRGIAAYNGPA
jgi:hypothetical protein